MDFAGPMEDIYYLIIVDNYTKWPEVLRCKRLTTEVSITFLHELFARLGVVDCLVSDNGTQFTSSDFKEFCDTFQIKHITTPPYHPRSNGLTERFVDTLKRVLKKVSGTPTEKAWQQFLQVYRISSNPNTLDATSPAETMFARKILRASSLGEDNCLVSYETFDRETANRERLVLLLYYFLSSSNTISFTYHPLFELFFHRSYLKATIECVRKSLERKEIETEQKKVRKLEKERRVEEEEEEEEERERERVGEVERELEG